MDKEKSPIGAIDNEEKTGNPSSGGKAVANILIEDNKLHFTFTTLILR